MLQDSKRVLGWSHACALLCCVAIAACGGDDDSGKAEMMGGANAGKGSSTQGGGAGGAHGGTGGHSGHAGSGAGTGGATHAQSDAGAHPAMDSGSAMNADGGAQDAASDGAAADKPCDLTGTWVLQHSTRNTALGADQIATNWNCHKIEQTGDRFKITGSFDCGYVVRGTTDVSLSDATLEAMALHATHAVGTEGTFKPTADGKCKLEFDRIYVLRGANKEKFLDAVWKIGDAPKSLDAFSLPANAAEGMEDWDHDGHEGLTQLTGLGDRYTAELDWHAYAGTVPQHSGQFGGDGVISVDYDSRESVSAETPALLQASSAPIPPGYGYMARVSDDEVEAQGDQKELQTCKNVQALAIEKFGDPPSP